MRRFIEFVVRYKNYITLSALIVMSFSFMSFGELSKLGGFRAVVVGTIGWIQTVFSWVPNPVALKSENDALRNLNLQLSTESARYRQAMVENSTLRAMLSLPEQSEHPLIAASVVGKTTSELRMFATLDKGMSSGVTEGMACVTDAGLAGIVVGSSDNFSVVRLLLNRDTRISSRVYRSQVDGILVWEGESTLLLKDVPRNFDVVVGDVIVTSQFSTLFPSNIVIGTVKKVSEENNSLFRRILVEPEADINTMSQVFIVDWLPEQERVALEDSIVHHAQEGTP